MASDCIDLATIGVYPIETLSPMMSTLGWVVERGSAAPALQTERPIVSFLAYVLRHRNCARKDELGIRARPREDAVLALRCRYLISGTFVKEHHLSVSSREVFFLLKDEYSNKCLRTQARRERPCTRCRRCLYPRTLNPGDSTFANSGSRLHFRTGNSLPCSRHRLHCTPISYA